MSETNLFIEIMELSGCLTYHDALTYFLHYADLVLGSYLDLYLLYGIALEGHQQNTLAIVQDGKIKRFIVTASALSMQNNDFARMEKIWIDSETPSQIKFSKAIGNWDLDIHLSFGFGY